MKSLQVEIDAGRLTELVLEGISEVRWGCTETSVEIGRTRSHKVILTVEQIDLDEDEGPSARYRCLKFSKPSAKAGT
jgi:hypothetical protein